MLVFKKLVMVRQCLSPSPEDCKGPQVVESMVIGDKFLDLVHVRTSYVWCHLSRPWPRSVALVVTIAAFACDIEIRSKIVPSLILRDEVLNRKILECQLSLAPAARVRPLTPEVESSFESISHA